MQVLEAINRMKASMHDVSNEYDDAACIFALNTAVHELAALLIAAHYPDLIEEKDFMDGDMVPEGFFRTCGSYPIRVTGSLAIKIAIKILLNHNEFDISQDSSIQSEIAQALQAGVG